MDWAILINASDQKCVLWFFFKLWNIYISINNLSGHAQIQPQNLLLLQRYILHVFNTWVCLCVFKISCTGFMLCSISCVPTNCDLRSGLKLSTGDRPAFKGVWTFYYFSHQVLKLRIFNLYPQIQKQAVSIYQLDVHTNLCLSPCFPIHSRLSLTSGFL